MERVGFVTKKKSPALKIILGTGFKLFNSETVNINFSSYYYY